MTLLQAIAYFIREAFLNLFRSWKISVLAILAIAVSLFLAGAFLRADAFFLDAFSDVFFFR